MQDDNDKVYFDSVAHFDELQPPAAHSMFAPLDYETPPLMQLQFFKCETLLRSHSLTNLKIVVQNESVCVMQAPAFGVHPWRV